MKWYNILAQFTFFPMMLLAGSSVVINGLNGIIKHESLITVRISRRARRLLLIASRGREKISILSILYQLNMYFLFITFFVLLIWFPIPLGWHQFQNTWYHRLLGMHFIIFPFILFGDISLCWLVKCLRRRKEGRK